MIKESYSEMKLMPYSRRATWLTGLSLFAVSSIGLFVSSVGGQPATGAVLAQEDFKAMTVFLVRHAEKADAPREDPPLLETGTARAQLLARILGKSGIKAIYTSQYLRTRATAEPLAKQLGIASVAISLKMSPSNARQVSSESIQEIVDRIYQKPGENALVIGHSNSVLDVIKALGVDVVPTVDEKEFDDLFVVTVCAKGKARVTHLKY
ncbi:MAG: histidine phosphatase family protein [Acidobacteriota bacterium]